MDWLFGKPPQPVQAPAKVGAKMGDAPIPDITAQRRNVATKAVTAATQLVDALTILTALKDQRGAFESDFADSDFVGTNLSQLSAAIIGTLFDFVVPALQTTYVDAGNSGRNKQILLQVRSG